MKRNIEPFYKKTKLVEEKLNAIIKNGVSASMLCLYAMDQIKFFETYVLGLREENIEETIASSTIGNIVHDSLELIYKDYVMKKLKMGDLKKMKEKINTTVQNIIRNYVREENIYKGKNIIIVETVKEYLKKVIELDQRTIEKGNMLKIIAVEREFENEIKDRGGKMFKIRGKIDRIDELNGEVRIIDYKSGKKLSKRNLTIKDSEELTGEKGIYNLQLLIYMLGISEEFSEKTIKSGIINLKNISEGVLEGVFNGKTELSNTEMENYKNEIITIITNILDKNKLFKN